MDLKERIDSGVQGKFEGLSNGFSRINDYIFGVQRGVYTLLGGMSGVFKTTLVDFILLNALQDAEAKNIEFNVHYFSFEIDEITKKCNWLSNIIFNKYNMIIPPELIKGYGKNRLTLDQQEIVNSEIDYVDSLFSKINFHFRSINPTGIYKNLMDFSATKGTFNFKEYKDEHGNLQKSLNSYTPNNPEAYNLVILDHLALLSKERGFTNKEVIDKYSEFCVLLRNLCSYSFINVSQFNDGLSSIERQKFKGCDISPQMTDFKDSRSPYADADIVIGLLSPYKVDLDTCLGYDVTRLKDKMIMLKIIKNRLSKDGIAIGLHVNPSAGSFSELPKANEINYQNYI